MNELAYCLIWINKCFDNLYLFLTLHLSTKWVYRWGGNIRKRGANIRICEKGCEYSNFLKKYTTRLKNKNKVPGMFTIRTLYTLLEVEYAWST